MDKRISRIARLVGMLCAAGCWGQFEPEALAAGYLSCTGPVPLRFGTEPAPSKPFVFPPLLADNVQPVSEPNPPAAASETNVTANTEAPSPQVTPEPTPPATETGPAPTLASPNVAAAMLDTLYGTSGEDSSFVPLPQPATAERGNAPASNVLVVTPQMLVDYFKPQAAAASNAGSVTTITPVGFTPAATFTAPSSQATYKVQ